MTKPDDQRQEILKEFFQNGGGHWTQVAFGCLRISVIKLWMSSPRWQFSVAILDEIGEVGRVKLFLV